MCSWSNGACVHYVIVSKFQWKPFWLATQWDPQNDWTATQIRRCELWSYLHRPHCGSARSKVSAVILNFKSVFAVSIILWTGSQSISFRSPEALPNPSPQNLFILGSRSSLSTTCLRTTPKSSIRRSFGRVRGSTSTPTGHKLNVSALVLSIALFCLCSSSWLSSKVLIVVYVVTPVFLKIHADKTPANIHLCSQFRCGDSLLVTDGLGDWWCSSTTTESQLSFGCCTGA